MAFDAIGNLYVTDFTSGAIRRISPTGLDLGNFAIGLGAVEGIAFDASGNLYAASYSPTTIEKFSPLGADLGTFASIGLNEPYGLAFDGAGNLYVANYGGTVRRFSSAGTDLGVFASAGLVAPRDLVVWQPPASSPAVPEPSTLLLLGAGLAGLSGVAWRRRHK